MIDRAGLTWTEDEDRLLLTQFDAGVPLSCIAELHQRTETAITARLARADRIIYVCGAWHKINPLPWNTRSKL